MGLAVLALTAVGLVMVYSASAIPASRSPRMARGGYIVVHDYNNARFPAERLSEQ